MKHDALSHIARFPSINVAPWLVVTILNIAWSTFQQIGGNTATRHCLSSIEMDNSRGNVTLLGAVNLLKDHAYSWRSIRIKRSQWTVREYLAFHMRIRSVSSNITTSNWLINFLKENNGCIRIYFLSFPLIFLSFSSPPPLPPFSLFPQSNKWIFVYLSALIADTKEYKGRC